ncbi:MarR family winged helix-turn-helix transcriptional regulator [Paenibacillus hexagrammi]|uniref:MarR family transcriptional regulator n=1 Tax=Paenibacillus hexagrammi TaxID=2908839 RepID=A0ABY3SPE8_9BACL|nr:MarR family transcriptional regulator [Paenibacillus sp. YPD9-1]UJF35717.1 MarR family transcriptional regulator [Paenibacillus sp. YPD9-1]
MENEIFKALIDLFALINRSDRDKKMIANAGVNLEEAAFRVLVGIAHLQPTSVGELADKMGKNYSSVSRQIDKLEAAGLVHTYPSSSDSRIRVSELTKRGEEINGMISLTRERMMREALADWTLEEKNDLKNNLKRLFEAMQRFD